MDYIVVIEDDENIRELVTYSLENNGYKVKAFETGAEFFASIEKKIPKLILLDIMLPKEDGISILKRIREKDEIKHIPVIMLTAKSREIDKVKALDLGADDYVTKPFGIMELLSRVKALLRRSGKMMPEEERYQYKGISVDIKKHEVLSNDKKCQLTFKEFELLRFLLANQKTVLSRDQIMDSVWGFDYAGESRTVDMHIKTLRQKLGPNGSHIKTVRNVGYKIGDD